MVNHSQPFAIQREMPMLAVVRGVGDAPSEFVAKCRNEIEAINLCINLSCLSDEAIYTALNIDKGHFSRLRKGRGNFPSQKRLDLMGLCGNRAPVQYEAMRLNCDLVDKTKDEQIKALEAQLQQLRAA